MKNYPFMLYPAGKDYLWGGTRLKEMYNKKIDLDPLAETWECSTHPDGLSYVATGEHKGISLKEVLKLHPEYLGTNVKSQDGEIPILVKFIDAKKDLSVQVHPNDEYASKFENCQNGKMEMWYVLDTTEDASLVCGFKQDVNKEIVKDSVESGTIEKYLNRINVKSGDSFFINPGTVHAIGAGTLVAEIQENSNITYRLYDYKRPDKNGKLRELHVDKALEVLNFKASNCAIKVSQGINSTNGYSSELLCNCEYFKVLKERINVEDSNEAYFKSEENSFHALLCIEGKGSFTTDKETISFRKGDCIFVPANSAEIKLQGNASWLNVSC